MERRSHYNKQLKPLARALRKYGTLGEAILWTQVLRAKNFYGLQFNRQFPIDRFIVDFVCRRLKLVIEIDGSSHDHKSEQDKERDLRLNELGYTVIRISESDVRRDLNNVIRTLVSYLPEEILNDDEYEPIPPPPFTKGEFGRDQEVPLRKGGFRGIDSITMQRKQ